MRLGFVGFHDLPILVKWFTAVLHLDRFKKSDDYQVIIFAS